MRQDFKQSMRIFIKEQVKQTTNVLYSLLQTVQSFDRPKNKLMDYNDEGTSKGGLIRKNVKSAQ